MGKDKLDIDMEVLRDKQRSLEVASIIPKGPYSIRDVTSGVALWRKDYGCAGNIMSYLKVIA